MTNNDNKITLAEICFWGLFLFAAIIFTLLILDIYF